MREQCVELENRRITKKNMYLYFGMGIDSPMQISTCGKQFMDAKIYNSKGSYILGTFEEKKRDQCLNLHR
jgi:hypothetical protein